MLKSFFFLEKALTWSSRAWSGVSARPESDCGLICTEDWWTQICCPKDTAIESECAPVSYTHTHTRVNIPVAHFVGILFSRKRSDLRSRRSLWQLPMKLPYWQEWTCVCSCRRKRSLNSKAQGNCSISCQTHSRNCSSTGDTSLGSPSRWAYLQGKEKVPDDCVILRYVKWIMFF